MRPEAADFDQAEAVAVERRDLSSRPVAPDAHRAHLGVALDPTVAGAAAAMSSR